MKKIKITLILITILNSYSNKIIAQSNDPVSDFKYEIDDFLLKLNVDSSFLDYRISTSNRKIKAKGEINDKTIKYRQKIKYYRSGLKKETITVKYLSLKKSVLLLKVVKLNNEYFFVLQRSHSSENKTIIEERLIDGRILSRVDKLTSKGTVIQKKN